MREIGMAEERESIPTFSGGSSDALSLGFRIIVYKRQDGDRFGCDLRQCLVMPLEELLRHNRKTPPPFWGGDEDYVGWQEGAGQEATAPHRLSGLEGLCRL